MRSFPTDDGENAICPHCWSDDLDPNATRCPHCAGSFGWSAMRRNVIRVVILVIALYLVPAIIVAMSV